jgi:acetyltransferase-like isoleucine patch superfamily enzyme
MAQLTGAGVSSWQANTYDRFISHGYSPRRAKLRLRFLKQVLGSVGKGCYISHSCKFVAPERISLGDRCMLSNSTIFGGQGGLTFGDDCLIGFECVFLTFTHRSDRTDIPVHQQGYFEAPITLGADVWTGCRVTVLPGVTIGDHAIVGSGAVVSDDVPANAIVGGVPARLIRMR